MDKYILRMIRRDIEGILYDFILTCRNEYSSYGIAR